MGLIKWLLGGDITPDTKYMDDEARAMMQKDDRTESAGEVQKPNASYRGSPIYVSKEIDGIGSGGI